MKNLAAGIILLICAAQNCSSQTPEILWRYDLHDESFGNGALGYLDSSGRLEIVFSCYWNDSFIYVVHADDGSLVWRQNMGGCNDAAPIIYDVDSDGHPEVILGSSCNPVLTCFNGATGAIKWQTPFGGTDSPLSIADVDGDGKPEILTGDFEGNLNCFDARTGHLKWQVPVDANSAIEASPALVDINGDGNPDIIVCTWAYGGNGDSTAVYAYDGLTHSLIWENRLPKDKIYHGASFADLNEDGKKEFAVSSYDGHVYLLNGEDGSEAWQYCSSDSSYIGDPVAIGDIDNDGHLDLVYVSGNGEVVALDRDGHFKWTYILDLYESSFRGPVLADVNNDDTLDVIFATSEGRLFALNGSRGNMLWNINLQNDYGNPLFGLEHGPLVASFKGDDTLDIFVVGGYADSDTLPGDFGRAYAIKVGKGTGPDWNMFQHDTGRSNCVCYRALSQPSSITESPTSIAFKGYPNPFSQNINFNVSVEANTRLSVLIFNEEGIAVKNFNDKEVPAGDYSFNWDGKSDYGNALSPGLYFCKITAGHKQSVKKIVLIK